MSMGLEICQERCNQCLFSENRIVSKARMADIVSDCRRKDAFFLCHKHSMAGRDVMCRGFYETQPPSQMQRIAERLNAIEFVPTPKEQP
jgi:hypothetical protein